MCEECCQAHLVKVGPAVLPLILLRVSQDPGLQDQEIVRADPSSLKSEDAQKHGNHSLPDLRWTGSAVSRPLYGPCCDGVPT